MRMRKSNFTLFELLIAVGLLVILAVVLLRTLVLTTDYWKYSAEQSDIYNDAKMIMAQLNSDISNMIYSRTARTTTNSDVAIPLYSRYLPDNNVGYTWMRNPFYSTSFYNSGTAYGWCTSMVTRTDMQITQSGSGSSVNTTDNANVNHSNICKVTYIFYPPALSGNSPIHGNNNVPGANNGVLVRGYVNENVNSNGLESGNHYLSGGRANLNAFYNGVWSNVVQMAEGLIEFRLDPYSYTSGSGFTLVTAFNNDGMSNVDALRLTMTMMPVEKLNKYREMVNNNAPTADLQAYFNKHSRRFTRTYWVKSMTF